MADNDECTPFWKLGQAAKNFHLNEQQFEEPMKCILSNHSCKDKSFLSDLKFLPPNLRIKAFEKKRVKQILNAEMERTPLKSYVLFVGSIEEGSLTVMDMIMILVLLAIIAFVVVVLLLNM